jgi:hypothetical protein
MLALPVNDPLSEKHVPDHADPEREFIILQVSPAKQVKKNMVNPER